MADVSVRVSDGGPYLVAGKVTLMDSDGRARALERDSIALCRCGHSRNKPFCDGSHRVQDFRASDRAG